MSGSGTPSLHASHTHARVLLSAADTVEAHGCTIVLRRVDGPYARELFFSCQPPVEFSDPGLQAEAAYRAILTLLDDMGGSYASVLCETVFHRNLRANLEPVREARRRVIGDGQQLSFGPAISEIEQPPLETYAWLELSIYAVLPEGASVNVEPVRPIPACDCVECTRSQGLLIHAGDEARLYSGSLYGKGLDAYQQTLAMFGAAETMLLQAGMQFGDVVRTSIYLREMERDYADLNRARRVFFEQRNIAPPPASTGIGAGLVSPDSHDLGLSVYAVKGGTHLHKTVMTTPTLNEAPHYGADFSRGMRVTESNKEALYVSGTASLNEFGETVHAGDFEAQVDRMLVNVAALLKAQGCGFDDVASAITYLKDPAHAGRLKEKFDEAGYTGFANTLVVAPVCRAELLCETEAIAIVKNNP